MTTDIILNADNGHRTQTALSHENPWTLFMYNTAYRVPDFLHKYYTYRVHIGYPIDQIFTSECLLSATDNLAPNVLFTDADLAMVSAIHEMLSSTKHNYCIWHLRKNLDKNLRGQLRKNYDKFVKA